MSTIPVFYFNDEIGSISITAGMTYLELLEASTQFFLMVEPNLLQNPDIGVSIFPQFQGTPLDTINRDISEWSLLESVKKDATSFGRWVLSLGSTELIDSPLDGRIINDTIVTGPGITNEIDRIQILTSTRLHTV